MSMYFKESTPILESKRTIFDLNLAISSLIASILSLISLIIMLIMGCDFWWNCFLFFLFLTFFKMFRNLSNHYKVFFIKNELLAIGQNKSISEDEIYKINWQDILFFEDGPGEDVKMVVTKKLDITLGKLKISEEYFQEKSEVIDYLNKFCKGK